jgi:hypothetical protein
LDVDYLHRLVKEFFDRDIIFAISGVPDARLPGVQDSLVRKVALGYVVVDWGIWPNAPLPPNVASMMR